MFVLHPADSFDNRLIQNVEEAFPLQEWLHEVQIAYRYMLSGHFQMAYKHDEEPYPLFKSFRLNFFHIVSPCIFIPM